MVRLSEGQAKAALVGVGAVWGTVGIFVRFIAVPAAMLALFRAFIGVAVIGLALFALRMRPNWAAIRVNSALLAASGLAIGINWLLLFQAYLHTSVAVATLCNCLAPAYVVALSPLVLGERLNVRKAGCVLVALVGMVLVSGVLDGGLPSGRNGLGVLYGLGSAVLYASAVLLNKRMRDVGGVEMALVQLLFAGLAVLASVALTGQWRAVVFDARSIAMIVVVGLVHTGLAYVFYFAAVERLPGQTLAAFSYIDPVVAIFVSWLVFSEPLDALGVLGALLIFGATFVASLEKPERRREPRPDRP